jgi:environmental stress-induced protein Ves
VAVILRAAERRAVPWKNGGGLTREVAVHPPGADLDNFAWRVSIAEVLRGGPFSSFAGVDRHMAVISGSLALAIAGRDQLTLAADGPPATFPGDLPVSAEPLQAPVTDLNVMTRRGRWSARLTHCSAPPAGEMKLAADITLIVAISPLQLCAADVQWRLAALDAVRFGAGAQPVTVYATGAGAAFWLIEISPV